MKLNLSILFVCLLTLSACTKKELPQPVEGTPSIWMQCKMNGSPFQLNVGENATYGTNISFTSANIKQFVFRIDDLNTKKSFEIAINNYTDSVGDTYSDLDKTIKPGKYSFIYTSAFPYFYFNPSEVSVSYSDKINKISFYSMATTQTGDAEFTIVSVKDVVEDGRKYKMAEIKFACTIQYDDGSNIWKYVVTDGHCVIPFGGY
jgi:hypothetical protein